MGRVWRQFAEGVRQRRLRELCNDVDALDYDQALLQARVAIRRAGLFASGQGKERILQAYPYLEPEDLDQALVAGRSRRIEDLMEPILSSLAFGDAVMVKGSKGVRLASLVELIKQRFSAAA